MKYSEAQDPSQYDFENPYDGGAHIVVPSLLRWLCQSSFAKLKQETIKAGNEQKIDFEKAEGWLNSFLNRDTLNSETGQRPAFAYCPSLTAKPIWKKEDDAELNRIGSLLLEKFPEIKDEYLEISKSIEKVTINTGKKFLEEGKWTNIVLFGNGAFSEHAEKFPVTYKVMQQFSDRIFGAEFVTMEGNTELPPHTDATNAYLACHMGLVVPQDCGVQVKLEVEDYKEGELLFFDQSYAHAAWNRSSETRVNLLITLLHPEISTAEVNLIQDYLDRIKKKVILFTPFILAEYLAIKLWKKLF